MNRRAQLSIFAPGASPDEAAAVVAAIEQFMRSTAPLRAEVPERPAAWQQAALHEAVTRQPGPPLPWE